MKIGIVICSNDSETVWNALRYSNFALVMGDEVRVFLLGKGVEIESLDRDVFKVTEQLQSFINSGGEVLVCGTCLRIRQMEASGNHTVATLEDIYRIVKESDRTLTF